MEEALQSFDIQYILYTLENCLQNDDIPPAQTPAEAEAFLSAASVAAETGHLRLAQEVLLRLFPFYRDHTDPTPPPALAGTSVDARAATVFARVLTPSETQWAARIVSSASERVSLALQTRPTTRRDAELSSVAARLLPTPPSSLPPPLELAYAAPSAPFIQAESLALRGHYTAARAILAGCTPAGPLGARAATLVAAGTGDVALAAAAAAAGGSSPEGYLARALHAMLSEPATAPEAAVAAVAAAAGAATSWPTDANIILHLYSLTLATTVLSTTSSGADAASALRSCLASLMRQQRLHPDVVYAMCSAWRALAHSSTVRGAGRLPLELLQSACEHARRHNVDPPPALRADLAALLLTSGDAAEALRAAESGLAQQAADVAAFGHESRVRCALLAAAGTAALRLQKMTLARTMFEELAENGDSNGAVGLSLVLVAEGRGYEAVAGAWSAGSRLGAAVARAAMAQAEQQEQI